MNDTDTAKQILQGDDTHPDILQALGLELLAEVERLREGISALVSEMTTTVHFYKASDETARHYAHSLKELIA